jgi:hypothetical protein
MRRQAASIWSCGAHSTNSLRPRGRISESIGRRYVRIYATPSSTNPAADELEIKAESSTTQPGELSRSIEDGIGTNCHKDARFEVLGAPFSLLSVQLSPSQNLYTRRGTLVALSGKAENVWLRNFSKLRGLLTNLFHRLSLRSHFSHLSAERCSEFLSCIKK